MSLLQQISTDQMLKMIKWIKMISHILCVIPYFDICLFVPLNLLVCDQNILSLQSSVIFGKFWKRLSDLWTIFKKSSKIFKKWKIT